MTKLSKISVLLSFCLLLAVSACTGAERSATTTAVSPQSAPASDQGIILEPNISEIAVEETAAQIIFLGRVDHISGTQDDGTTQSHHQLSLTVEDVALDELNIGSGLVLTVAGPSPVDYVASFTDGRSLLSQPTHQLQIGSEVVVFAHEAQLDTVYGKTAVLMPISNRNAFLNADSWDSVTAQLTSQQ